MKTKQHILIMGYGEIGKAVHEVLDRSSATISVWDIDQTKMPKKMDLESCATQADVIFICTHSWNLRSAAELVRPCVRKNTRIILVSKGIDPQTGLLPFQLIEKLLPHTKVSILFGPMLGEEIRQGKPWGAVIASPARSEARRIKVLFKTKGSHMEMSDDRKSVTYAGVLKNVYSVLMGLVQASKMGSNAAGIAFEQSLREMKMIMKRLRLDPDVIETLAGIGDFSATAFSPYSSNRKAGMVIMKGKVSTIRSEGTQSLRPLIKKLSSTKDLHFLRILDKILHKKAHPKKALDSFFRS